MSAVRILVLAAAISSMFILSATYATAGQEGSVSYEKKLSDAGYGIGLIGGYGVEIGDPPELDFAQVMPFISFPMKPVGSGFFRGVPEYKVEAVLGYVDNWNHHGIFGLSPVGLRYNLTAADSRVVPFVEGELGMVYLNVPKSIQGTRFNFTESAGVGVRVFVADGAALEVSCRYRHLSNAGIRKPNPGLNTLFLLAGVSFY